jgi:hypothetical protein
VGQRFFVYTADLEIQVQRKLRLVRLPLFSAVCLVYVIKEAMRGPFAAADIQDGDRHKRHSGGKKNGVDRLLPSSVERCRRRVAQSPRNQNRMIVSMANISCPFRVPLS